MLGGVLSKNSTSRRPLVVLDTNMLMLAASGVRVFEQIEEELETKPDFVVLKPVYDELVKIATSYKSSTARKALLALRLAEQYCRIVEYTLRPGESVDDAIVNFALQHNAIVATNDRELRRKLRLHGIPEAYFREEARRVKVEGVPRGNYL
ncbi:MAG: 30S processome protein Utp24 [Desulfurococcaceae archaeon]|nr:30S processome protein Utp24 [Desulfurococcaceae archaeon]